MDLKEVNELTITSERKHWWIKTRFLYINKLFDYVSNKSLLNIAEFGCGTGQNLWYIKNQSKLNSYVSHAIGIDPNLPDNFSTDWQDETYKLSNDLTAYKKGEVDIALAMDVLEHIDDHESALKQWKETLKEDGVILLTVPAFQSLWSYHDEFLDHKRRYTKNDLLDITRKAGLKPIYIKYAFGHLFPIVYIIRKLSKGNKNQQDLVLPMRLINTLLYFAGFIEKLLGGNPIFGTSVIGIFKVDKNI